MVPNLGARPRGSAGTTPRRIKVIISCPLSGAGNVFEGLGVTCRECSWRTMATVQESTWKLLHTKLAADGQEELRSKAEKAGEFVLASDVSP